MESPVLESALDHPPKSLRLSPTGFQFPIVTYLLMTMTWHNRTTMHTFWVITTRAWLTGRPQLLVITWSSPTNSCQTSWTATTSGLSMWRISVTWPLTMWIYLPWWRIPAIQSSGKTCTIESLELTATLPHSSSLLQLPLSWPSEQNILIW